VSAQRRLLAPLALSWRAMAVFLAVGAAFLIWFFLHLRSQERAGKEPLPTRLFKNRSSNLGLVTQNLQWLLGASSRVVAFAPGLLIGSGWA
jgi:hypothetical protein